MAIKIKWRENEEAVLVNVYAPNDRNEHKDFWSQLEAKRRSKNIRRPDFLLGDFNVTEDPIDRAPIRSDDPNAIEALRNLRHSLDLQDTWRHAFPHDRSFTYCANCNGQQIKSRLDRIYTSSAAARHTYGWKICQTAVLTDHWMVLAKYAPAEAPYIGKGRWTWQIPSLENKDLMKAVVDRGKRLQEDISQAQRAGTDRRMANPQTLWKQFKDDIREIAKKHNKESRAKTSKRMTLIREDMNQLHILILADFHSSWVNRR